MGNELKIFMNLAFEHHLEGVRPRTGNDSAYRWPPHAVSSCSTTVHPRHRDAISLSDDPGAPPADSGITDAPDI